MLIPKHYVGDPHGTRMEIGGYELDIIGFLGMQYICVDHFMDRKETPA
jgi:hypothetical protein